jgi:hypothetical protein
LLLLADPRQDQSTWDNRSAEGGANARLQAPRRLMERHSCCPVASHPYFWLALSPDSASHYILCLAAAKNVNALFRPPNEMS